MRFDKRKKPGLGSTPGRVPGVPGGILGTGGGLGSGSSGPPPPPRRPKRPARPAGSRPRRSSPRPVLRRSSYETSARSVGTAIGMRLVAKLGVIGVIILIAIIAALVGGGGNKRCMEAENVVQDFLAADIRRDGGAAYDCLSSRLQGMMEIQATMISNLDDEEKATLCDELGIPASQADSLTGREFFALLYKAGGGGENISGWDDSSQIEITGSEQRGDRAYVGLYHRRLREEDAAELVREGGAWKIDFDPDE